MKKIAKIIGIFSIFMGINLVLLTVQAKTLFEFDDWDTADGYYGTKTKVSDNIINLTGVDHGQEAFAGQVVGPFTKKSTGSLLKDDIVEELYIEVGLDKFDEGELFEATVSLDQEPEAEKQLTEKVVMTQRSNNAFNVTAGWAKEPIATLTDNGVYTYRWHYFIKDGKAYINFTVLLGDEEKGTTGDLEVSEIDVSTMPLVAVRSVWLCNIKAKNGVNIHQRLPQTIVDTEIKSEDITTSDENISDILKESLKLLKEFTEFKDQYDFNIKLEAQEINVSEEKKNDFKKIIANSNVSEFFNIDILVEAGEETYNLTELVKPISLTLALPDILPPVEKGYTRTYYILREHDGDITPIKTILSEDKKSISFETDRFSTYALAYVDEKETETDQNPQTGDQIISFISLSILSLFALGCLTKVLKNN